MQVEIEVHDAVCLHLRPKGEFLVGVGRAALEDVGAGVADEAAHLIAVLGDGVGDVREDVVKFGRDGEDEALIERIECAVGLAEVGGAAHDAGGGGVDDFGALESVGGGALDAVGGVGGVPVAERGGEEVGGGEEARVVPAVVEVGQRK